MSKSSDSEARRAVFLDRDGVINEVVYRDCKPGSPRHLTEFRFHNGIKEPLKELRAAGYRLFIVTNQPDIARGLLSRETLAACHQMIIEELPIEAVRLCPHDDRDDCECRKPRPGMLLQLAAETGVDLASSYFIGDTGQDADAARAAGCKSVLLDRPYNRANTADYRVLNMEEAAKVILRRAGKPSSSS